MLRLKQLLIAGTALVTLSSFSSHAHSTIMMPRLYVDNLSNSNNVKAINIASDNTIQNNRTLHANNIIPTNNTLSLSSWNNNNIGTLDLPIVASMGDVSFASGTKFQITQNTGVTTNSPQTINNVPGYIFTTSTSSNGNIVATLTAHTNSPQDDNNVLLNSILNSNTQLDSLVNALNSTNMGNINNNEDLILEARSNIVINANDTNFIADGSTLNIVESNNTASASNIVSNVPGYNFTSSTSPDGNVTITANKKSEKEWTNEDHVINALLIDSEKNKGVFNDLISNIFNQKDLTTRKTILESIAPTVNGTITISAADVTREIQSLAGTRMASLRTNTGMAAGDEAMKNKFWMQGYYSYADQDTRHGVAGYESDTAGLMLGVDSEDLIDEAILGIAFNYGSTNADSDNANTTDTDSNSYGLTFYGSKSLTQDLFFEGQIGYAYSDIDIVRHACGAATGTCTANTNSNQISAKTSLGIIFSNAKEDAFITPKLYTAYVGIDTDAYTEIGTGLGANPLNVSSSHVDIFDIGLDVEASWNIKQNSGTLKPTINAGYAYDTIGDEVEVTSSFAGIAASTAFKTTGAKAAQSKFNLGAGLKYEAYSNWDISAKYDAVLKADYESHDGTLNISTRF